MSIAPAVVALAAMFMVLPRGGADAEIEMVSGARGFAFAPESLEVDPGDRVAFENETGVTHTATCVGCPWDAGDIRPGETKFVTFHEEAAYQFFCRYHGSQQNMVGRLIVGTPPPAPAPSPSPTLADSPVPLPPIP